MRTDRSGDELGGPRVQTTLVRSMGRTRREVKEIRRSASGHELSRGRQGSGNTGGVALRGEFDFSSAPPSRPEAREPPTPSICPHPRRIHADAAEPPERSRLRPPLRPRLRGRGLPPLLRPALPGPADHRAGHYVIDPLAFDPGRSPARSARGPRRGGRHARLRFRSAAAEPGSGHRAARPLRHPDRRAVARRGRARARRAAGVPSRASSSRRSTSEPTGPSGRSSDAMLDYAADDTRYLMRLADILTEELAEAGRTAWAEEECRALGARGRPWSTRARSEPEDPVRPGEGRQEAAHAAGRRPARRARMAGRDRPRARTARRSGSSADGPLVEAVLEQPAASRRPHPASKASRRGWPRRTATS